MGWKPFERREGIRSGAAALKKVSVAGSAPVTECNERLHLQAEIGWYRVS